MTNTASPKTPNIDRRTLIIAVAILVAAIAGTFAVSLATHHSSEPTSTASSSSSRYPVTSQAQRLADVYNRYSRSFYQEFSTLSNDSGMADICVVSNGGSFANHGLESTLSDLGFSATVYRGIIHSPPVTSGGYSGYTASASDYYLVGSWSTFSPHYLSVLITANW